MDFSPRTVPLENVTGTRARTRTGPGRRNGGGRARWCLLLLAALFCTADAARADLVGQPAHPPQLSAVEAAMLERNPALQPLATEAPWALRTVLNALAQSRRGGVSSSTDMSGLNRDDAAVLNQNPALREVWRSSPEAAADLLALIRAAAASGDRPAK
jgi:hypothetical protein